MSERYFISIALVFLTLTLASPGNAEPTSSEEAATGPIVITADTLTADAKTNTAVFTGNVVAKTSELTLTANRMTVFYSSDGEIIRIDVEENVKLLRESRTVTSNNARYLAKERKIVFTGEPMVLEGQNVITGSEITYLIDEDRSVVQDSKVYIKRDRGN